MRTPWGRGPDGPSFGWIGLLPLSLGEANGLRQASRFAAAPLVAFSARAALTADLEAYLGRRSAAPVIAGPSRQRCSMLTALSENNPPRRLSRLSMPHLDEARRRQGLSTCPSGRLCISARCFGAISVLPDRLDFTAIGTVNLVSRLEGLCRPLDKVRPWLGYTRR